VTDANQELLNTLEFMELNLPDHLQMRLDKMLMPETTRAEKRRLRQGVLHLLGNMVSLCLAGGARAIPEAQVEQYEQILEKFRSCLLGLKRVQIEILPQITAELARVSHNREPGDSI
jgi:hypothetical protein